MQSDAFARRFSSVHSFSCFSGSDNESQPGSAKDSSCRGKRKNELEKKYDQSQVRLTVPRTSPGKRLLLFLFLFLPLVSALLLLFNRVQPRIYLSLHTYFVVSEKERRLISVRILVHLPRDISYRMFHANALDDTSSRNFLRCPILDT